MASATRVSVRVLHQTSFGCIVRHVFYLAIIDIEGDSIFIQTDSKRSASSNQMQHAVQKCFMHGILQIVITEGGLAESYMHM